MQDLLKSLLALIILALMIKVINKPLRKGLKCIVCCKSVSNLVLKFLIFYAEHKRQFKPPGSGALKKAWVKQHYAIWTDKADDVVDEAIDFIVAALRSRKGIVEQQTSNQIGEVAESSIDVISKKEIETDDGLEELTDSDLNSTTDAVG